MALQKPCYTFTIPSLQDDTILDCRLYIPTSKRQKVPTTIGRSAAIIAHPYAPLGGSQDDPVVAIATSVLLKHEYIVGTFNFRGAGDSAGRTSWSAKLELADYVSFFGFMLFYLNGITESKVSSEDVTASNRDNNDKLILAGYSYGSLIAKNLPPVSLVAEIFANPPVASAQAEIVLRAQDLSQEYLRTQPAMEQSMRGRNSVRTSANLLVGGFESEAACKRVSRESSRRSLDLEGVRRSVDRIKKRSSRRASDRYGSRNSTDHCNSQVFARLPKICYLLISPLLPPITAFLSLSGKVKLSASVLNGKESSYEDPLLQHDSCCVFGRHDIFTSYKRLQKWGNKTPTNFTGHIYKL